MGIYADCKVCGQRFEAEIKNIQNPVCEHCAILSSENLPALLKLLKSKKIPGHEPIIHVLTLLYKRIEQLEADQIPKEKVVTK